MEAMQKRFNILGMVLTLIIVIGLIVQYMYLNKIVTKEKQNNLITIREHLAEDINSVVDSYSQYINISAEIIGARDWTDQELTDYVTKLAKSNTNIKSIYYGDKTNKLINSDNWQPPKGYDVRTRHWYFQAVGTDELVISNMYSAAIDGTAVISISKSVYTSDGSFMGVVSADVRVEEIIKIVEETKVQGSGYSLLIDRRGNILGHPNYKHNLGSEILHIDALARGMYNQIKDVKTGQIKTELDGLEGYLTFKPVQNTNWIIGNFISLKEFKGNSNELWRLFFIAVMSSVVIFFSFTSIQRKTFLIPLLKLDEDIGKIDLEKNITYRIPIEGKDSFERIKETLNLALKKIEELFEQVEQDKEYISIKNNKLNYLSYNDQLTDLYNRRYFEEQLPLIDRKENLPITIIMGDANGLKLINDSFGHKAGDNLLIAIADNIKKGCRVDDIVARISGDEFVIILPKTDYHEAKKVINRISKLNAENKVVTDKFSNIEISISYGYGTKYDRGTSIFETLKAAEDNMYYNKLFEGPGMRKKTIETILKELSQRETNKENHSANVAKTTRELGMELGMTQEELEELEDLGRVHDIGEIGIEEEILNKEGDLTSKEWEEIKKHPEIGYRILSTVNEMSNLAYYTLSHHERYDGTGYPKGLKGTDIPLASRILTIADAYDAMQSNRPYRKALNEDKIVGEFIEKAGSQFDPDLSRLFVEKLLKKEWTRG